MAGPGNAARQDTHLLEARRVEQYVHDFVESRGFNHVARRQAVGYRLPLRRHAERYDAVLVLEARHDADEIFEALSRCR